MKVKRIFAGIVAAAVIASVMTACSQNGSTESTASKESKAASAASQTQSSQPEQNSKPAESSGEDQGNAKMYTLTVRDDGKSEKLTATFINTMSGASTDVPMAKTAEESDHFVFSCEADVTKFNMVHLDYGGESPTHDVAFNDYVSGWYLSNGLLRPYETGKQPDYNTKYETATLKFDGYDKDVYIWTPDDYDPKSEVKYSTLYVFDGQSTLSDALNPEGEESWHIAEHAKSMMSLTDNKLIVVAIVTDGDARNNELIPDLGEIAIKNYPTTKRGNAFADFLCDTVIPYVEGKFNVYSDPEHTAVAGSSLGGLEAFYAAVAHPEKFGAAGALSPAFWAYGVKAWAGFLMPKVTQKDLPYLYLYAGDYELDSGAYTLLMYSGLLQYGYPKDKVVCDIYRKGEHLSKYWQNMFPEFLHAMFEHKLSAIENGAAVSLPESAQKSLQNYQNEQSSNEREPTAKDYVYFDNSKTKWKKVCAYWWGPYGASTTKITSNEYYDHKWPGLEMEKIGDSDIYRVIAPSGAVGIIFDNGVSDEEMAEGNEIYQTNDITYDKKTHPGKVYTIDDSQQAKPGRGVDQYKYKYPAGEWSDYKE